MTRSLIYIITIFALWLYFKYGNFSKTSEKTVAEKITVEDMDKGRSGSAGWRA